MKRLCLAVVVLVMAAAPAFADVTVAFNMSMSAGPMAMSGQTTILLKGTKARSDAKVAGQEMSVLFDSVTKQMLMVNHVTREVTAYDPLQALAGAPMTFGDVRASVKPLGQTKEILGRACQGFTVELVMPMTMGGESLTMKAIGQVWMAKDGPGVAEYRSAQKVLADAGFSTSPFGQGPSVKGMLEVGKALADAGIPLEQDLHMTMEGAGQVAQMMGQMGEMTMTMTVTAISTDPIPDEKFKVPEGYTKK